MLSIFDLTLIRIEIYFLSSLNLNGASEIFDLTEEMVNKKNINSILHTEPEHQKLTSF